MFLVRTERIGVTNDLKKLYDITDMLTGVIPKLETNFKDFNTEVAQFSGSLSRMVKGLTPTIDRMQNLAKVQDKMNNSDQLEQVIFMMNTQIAIQEEMNATLSKGTTINKKANKIRKVKKKTTEEEIHSMAELRNSLLSVHSVTKDMEKTTLNNISQSKLWTATSRILSGTGLWAIQNQIRAIIDIANIWEQKKLKGIEQDDKKIKALNDLMTLQKKAKKVEEDLKKAKKEFLKTGDEELLQKFDSYKLMIAQGIEKDEALKLLEKEIELTGKLAASQEEKMFGKEGGAGQELAAVKAQIQVALNEGDVGEWVNLQKDLKEAQWKRWKELLTFQKTRDKFTKWQEKFKAQGGMKMMAQRLKTMAMTAFTVLIVVIAAIVIITSLVSLITEFKDGFAASWAFFMGILEPIFTLLSGSFSWIFEGLGKVFTGLIEGDLPKVLEGLGQFFLGLLGTIFFGAIALLGTIWAGIWTLASGIFVGMWASGKDIGHKILGIILTVVVIAGMIAAIVAFVVGAPIWLGALILAGIVAVGVMLIKGIKKAISPFADGGTVSSGLSLVGEKGPELVNLPAGSKVHSNSDSRKMVGGSSVTNNITVNVKGSMGSSDAEIRVLADKIGKMIGKEINRTTNAARF